jgi:hypothetical protein
LPPGMFAVAAKPPASTPAPPAPPLPPGMFAAAVKPPASTPAPPAPPLPPDIFTAAQYPAASQAGQGPARSDSKAVKPRRKAPPA